MKNEVWIKQEIDIEKIEKNVFQIVFNNKETDKWYIAFLDDVGNWMAPSTNYHDKLTYVNPSHILIKEE